MKLFSIPNLLTLGNLSCGCLAIFFAFEGDLVTTAYLVGLAAVLDFFDGFVARALKQFSPIGKELDSLADMVTFGVVPGVVMFQLLRISFNLDVDQEYGFPAGKSGAHFFAFLITLFSALRLAKFNVDTRQSESFVGVPTPANAILICSLPLILGIESIGRFMSDWNCACPETTAPYLRFLMNDTVLWTITLTMSYLLIAEIPLFALKFKSFSWKGNEIRYSFLAVSLVMVVLLQYIALPLIIVLYILLSIINNMARRSSSKEQPVNKS